MGTDCGKCCVDFVYNLLFHSILYLEHTQELFLLTVIAQQTIVFRNPNLKVVHLRNQVSLVLIVRTGVIQPHK